MVPPARIELALPKERDFESRASTSSARGALSVVQTACASFDFEHKDIMHLHIIFGRWICLSVSLFHFNNYLLCFFNDEKATAAIRTAL